MEKRIEIMPHLRNGGPVIKTLLVLTAIASVLLAIRFVFGIGAVANLTDGYSWGLKKAFAVTGVALAAGGFSTAAFVHLFGREKYHVAARPAILSSFIGYTLFVMFGLAVDVGRPWALWQVIVSWNRTSALAEVAWCVFLYVFILAIEFAPAVLKKYDRPDLQKKVDVIGPWLAITLVSWFVWVMTANVYWTGGIFLLQASMLVFFGMKMAKSGTVLLVYLAGVIFSTAHQSSIGTLFLIVDTKLSNLWQTPFLPLNFYFSAIAVGFAMVIMILTLSSKALGNNIKDETIQGLGKVLAVVLAFTLAFRLYTLYLQTGFDLAGTGASGALMASFGIEMIGGFILPLILLAISKNPKTIFRAALMIIILGVVLGRFNVTFIGFTTPGYGLYIPHPFEILITAGLISGAALIFYLVAKNFPVIEHDSAH